MIFIELTRVTGEFIYIRKSSIVAISSNSLNTQIYTSDSGTPFKVANTVDEVFAKMQRVKRVNPIMEA